MLDSADRLGARQHSANREEAGLHHRVNAIPHAGFASDLDGVNHKEPHSLADDLLLGGAWQVVPNLVGTIRTVQQKSGVALGRLQHVKAFEKRKVVAGDKTRPADQISRVNGPGAEPQVRDRH